MNFTLQPETPYQNIGLPSKSLSLKFSITFCASNAGIKAGLRLSLTNSPTALYFWIEDHMGVLKVRNSTNNQTVTLTRSTLLTKSGNIKLKCLIYVTAGQGFLSIKSNSGRIMTQTHLDSLDGEISAAIFNESASDVVNFNAMEILDFSPIDGP